MSKVISNTMPIQMGRFPITTTVWPNSGLMTMMNIKKWETALARDEVVRADEENLSVRQSLSWLTSEVRKQP